MEAVRQNLLNAFRAGRPAQGYILEGSVFREGRALAEWIGAQLLGDTPAVAQHAHPDMPWFEPEKKSRIIGVEMMREEILPFAQQSALSGGWKIVVIVSADRLKAEAANAFLKTLEEPPPKTLFLLLADSTSDLLPTIVSRCQLVQTGGERRLDEPWRAALLELLAGMGERSALRNTVCAERLCALLDDMADRADREVRAERKANRLVEDEEEVLRAASAARAKAWRGDLFFTLELWMKDLYRLKACGGGDTPLSFPEHRDTLLARARAYPLARLAENLSLLDTLAGQLERNIPPAQILPYWLDRFCL